MGVEVLVSKGRRMLRTLFLIFFEKNLKVGPGMGSGFKWRRSRRRRIFRSSLLLMVMQRSSQNYTQD